MRETWRTKETESQRYYNAHKSPFGIVYDVYSAVNAVKTVKLLVLSCRRKSHCYDSNRTTVVCHIDIAVAKSRKRHEKVKNGCAD